MKIILFILGAGTIMSLLTFIFGLWFVSAIEHSTIVLKRRIILGSFLIISGIAACLFVFITDRLITHHHVFYAVGFGMTAICGAELILCGLFFCKPAFKQKKIIVKLCT